MPQNHPCGISLLSKFNSLHIYLFYSGLSHNFIEFHLTPFHCRLLIFSSFIPSPRPYLLFSTLLFFSFFSRNQGLGSAHWTDLKGPRQNRYTLTRLLLCRLVSSSPMPLMRIILKIYQHGGLEVIENKGSSASF